MNNNDNSVDRSQEDSFPRQGQSELPIGWGGVVLTIIRLKLLLQEPSHMTSLLSAGGLGLLVALSLICK